MVTRFESRFSQSDSTRITVNDSSQSYFYNISEFLIDKPSSFAHKEMRIFFAPVIITIGGNFLSSCAMMHFKDHVSPTFVEADLRLCFQ